MTSASHVTSHLFPAIFLLVGLIGSFQCDAQGQIFDDLCSVRTTRVHDPWTRPVNTGVILDTREHGPLRSAVVIIMFYLQDGCSKWRPVKLWTRVMCTGL